MKFLTVDDLDEFNDQDLIDEIEFRGWTVNEKKGKPFILFSDEELDVISQMTMDSKPTSVEYGIYLKTRKNAQ